MNTGANYYLIWELAGAEIVRTKFLGFRTSGFGYIKGEGAGHAGGWGGGSMVYYMKKYAA